MMEIIYDEETYIAITCPFCGCINQVRVDEVDYLNWDWGHGIKAQDAFPYLSVNELEMLTNGICPTCGNKMFGGKE